MNSLSRMIARSLIASCIAAAAHAREWTDATGHYKLEADLIASNDKTVVLQRTDHDLVAIPLEQLSEKDREYLKSAEVAEALKKITDAPQTWTLRDGTKIVGRFVDYAAGDLTIQRRRGRIYINDRVLDNLPDFYQQLAPKIVSHFEELPRTDRPALDEWILRQRGVPRTFALEGVVLELQNGDEYSIPFFLLSEDDLKVLKPGWSEWQEAHRGDDAEEQQHQAYLLQSLAAARARDAQVQRDIAMMQLKLQAVQVGLTSLWEVTLHPSAGQGGCSQWVVVPGRDSRQATAKALEQFPGFTVGPIRRVAGF